MEDKKDGNPTQQNEGTPPQSAGPAAATTPTLSQPPKPKGRLKLALKLILLAVIFLIGVTYGISDYQKRKTGVPESRISEPTRTGPETSPGTTPDGKKIYSSETYGFSLEYPKTAVIKDLGPGQNLLQTLEITPILEADPTLSGSYSFKIVIRDISGETLMDIAQRKLNYYQTSCQETAQITKLSPVLLADYWEASRFDVKECPPDIRETFTSKNGWIYEMIQTSQGDLGISQINMSITEEIMDSMVFAKAEDPRAATHDKFVSEAYRLSFWHPRLNAGCCDINGPVAGTPIELAVLARVADDASDKPKNFDGVAVFVDENLSGLSFEAYLEQQKTSLKKDYELVTGKVPDVKEDVVVLGTEKTVGGTMLRNYAWWGDIVYARLPKIVSAFGVTDDKGGGTDKFLIIVKTEQTGGSFDAGFNEILGSFEFF